MGLKGTSSCTLPNLTNLLAMQTFFGMSRTWPIVEVNTREQMIDVQGLDLRCGWAVLLLELGTLQMGTLVEKEIFDASLRDHCAGRASVHSDGNILRYPICKLLASTPAPAPIFSRNGPLYHHSSVRIPLGLLVEVCRLRECSGVRCQFVIYDKLIIISLLIVYMLVESCSVGMQTS
jgi:hypothetical protein